MAETLADKTALWLAGDGPEASVVVASECSLLRNLSDFPFPARFSDEERCAVERRVVNALSGGDLLPNGQYCPLSMSQSRLETPAVKPLTERFLTEQLLVERRLVAFYEILGRDARGGLRFEAPDGAYVADDQGLSVMVNGADHVCIRALASGLQPLEVWARLNMVDDILAGSLDYAFDDRYGHLTSDLGHVGTGLRAGVILHLPALAMTGQLGELAQIVQDRQHVLRGLKPTVALRILRGANAGEKALHRKAGEKMARDDAPASDVVNEALYSDWYGTLCGTIAEAEGDLYLLSNVSTLGISEEEIVYHLRHLSVDVVAKEHEARETLEREGRRRLEDRVCRALGLARNARLLGFSEGLELLSSIRLGVSTGLIADCSMRDVNELLISSQSFHVRTRTGHDSDELAVSVKRADLFRAQFSPN